MALSIKMLLYGVKARVSMEASPAIENSLLRMVNNGDSQPNAFGVIADRKSYKMCQTHYRPQAVGQSRIPKSLNPIQHTTTNSGPLKGPADDLPADKFPLPFKPEPPTPSKQQHHVSTQASQGTRHRPISYYRLW